MVVTSVVNTLKVLEALSRAGAPVGVTEIAELTGVTKALAFRHLRTLTSAGYVEQAGGPGAPYGVAARLYLLGRSVIENLPLYQVGSQTIRLLARQTGMTAVLAAIEDEQLVIMDVAMPEAQLEWSAQVGMFLSLQHSAQGKVATAFGPANLTDTSFRDFQPTALSTQSLEQFRQEVAEVRSRGWANAPGREVAGTNAVAAPVLLSSGELAGTIAVLGSMVELPSDPPQDIVKAVLYAASEIGTALADN